MTNNQHTDKITNHISYKFKIEIEHEIQLGRARFNGEFVHDQKITTEAIDFAYKKIHESRKFIWQEYLYKIIGISLESILLATAQKCIDRYCFIDDNLSTSEHEQREKKRRDKQNEELLKGEAPKKEQREKPDLIVNNDTYSYDGKILIKSTHIKDIVEPVTYQDGTEIIGEKACLGNRMAEIKLPDSIKTIEFEGFSSCSSMEKINFPEGLEEIDDFAFSWCVNLKDYCLPASLKKIGRNPFAYCSARKLVSHSSRFVFRDRALIDLEEHRLIGYLQEAEKYHIRYNKRKKKFQFINDPHLPVKKHYVIPDYVTVIEDSAFRGQYNLTKLTISKNVKELNGNPFADNFFSSIECLSPHFKVENNLVLSADGKIVYAFYGELSHVILPATVTTLAPCAFDCCDFKTLTIPASLENVSTEPFRSCKKLETIFVPLGYKEHFSKILPEFTNLIKEGRASTKPYDNFTYFYVRQSLLNAPKKKDELPQHVDDGSLDNTENED